MEDKVTLYIATHNITGKKYFGKTCKWFTVEELQENYHGSGKHWNRHKNKHGKKDVTMSIYQICSLNELDEDYVVPIALKFSEENDIVKSKEWANEKYENGLDGNPKGMRFNETHKTNIGIASSQNFKNIDSNNIQNSLDALKYWEYKSEEELNIINSKKSQPGRLNGRATKVIIYNEMNEIAHLCYGNFKIICEENNLPLRKLRDSYQNNGRKISKGEFSGWYATQEQIVSKKNYNKLKKVYTGKAKFPDYPNSKKLTKPLEKLFKEYEIEPFN